MYYNAYEKDIAVVNIYFGKPTVFGRFLSWTAPSKVSLEIPFYCLEFERSAKMTWFDFISSIGGVCGLCLGISFVSVIEIIYWFSIRLFKEF